jgi:hypothetical protein
LADCCEAEGSDDCFDANEQTCSSYGICFILPEVASACSHTSMETDAGHKACYDLCYPKSCCFNSGLDNCYDDNQKECMKYAACFTLLAFHGGDLPPPGEFSLGSGDEGSSGAGNGGNDKPLSSTHTDVGDICSLNSPEVSVRFTNAAREMFCSSYISTDQFPFILPCFSLSLTKTCVKRNAKLPIVASAQATTIATKKMRMLVFRIVHVSRKKM